MSEKKNNKKIRQGVVQSVKAEKTITVKVERRIKHPVLGKVYQKSKSYMAHDENNDCKAGDVVKIIESRPLSAKKRWRLLEIVERAK